MARALLIFGLVLCVMIAAGQGAVSAQADVQGAGQVAVRVEPAHLQGPRVLAEQTEQGAIRDYLDAWKAMRAAMNQNQPGLLNADFVGTAKDKLTETIHEQAAAGIHTQYQDRAHDLQVVFYSPDGLSIELIDKVDYDVQVFDNQHSVSTQQTHAQYVVLLTPAEVRWRVRVFQAQ
jgi:hypothetical protein